MARQVRPKHAIIAEPRFNQHGLMEFLNDHGIQWRLKNGKDDVFDYDWPAPLIPGVITGAELIPIFAGKLCYMSFDGSQNPNVDSYRTDAAEIMESYKAHAHTRLFTHPHFSILFWNISRDTAHQMQTHDTGTTRTEKSYRYCSVVEMDVVVPPNLPDEQRAAFMEAMDRAEADVQGIHDRMLEGHPDPSFFKKKHATDMGRKAAPGSMATAFLLTANAQALRHMIQLRSEGAVSPEFREVINNLAPDLVIRYPLLFGDLKPEKVGLFNRYRSPYGNTPYDQAKLVEKDVRIEELERQLALAHRKLKEAQR